MTVGLVGVEGPDHVRVVEPADQPHLPLEPGDDPLVGHDLRRDDLQRHHPAHELMVGLVDPAHRPRTRADRGSRTCPPAARATCRPGTAGSDIRSITGRGPAVGPATATRWDIRPRGLEIGPRGTAFPRARPSCGSPAGGRKARRRPPSICCRKSPRRCTPHRWAGPEHMSINRRGGPSPIIAISRTFHHTTSGAPDSRTKFSLQPG